MARYINPQTRSFGKILSDEFAREVQQGIQGYAKQQEIAQERALREQQAQYLIEQGIDPRILDQPTGVQSQLLKNLLKPQSYGEMASSFLPGGATPRPGALAGGRIAADQQTTGAPYEMPQERPSFLNTLGGLTTGLGAGALSRLLGFKGDLADLALSGADYLAGPLIKPEDQPEILARFDERMSKLDPNSDAYKDLAAQREFYANPPRLTDFQKVLPSTRNIKKVIKGAGEQVGLDELTGGKNPQAEFWGEVASTLANPSKWATPWSAAKDILKAGGVAAGGDFAGHMTEKVTGSPFLGNLARLGTYVTYSMYPGSLKNMGDQRLQTVNKTLRQAEEQGVKVNTKRFKPEFDKLGKKIDKIGTETEAYKWLNTEAEKVEDLFRNRNLNPVQLETNMREMMDRYSQAPAQAQPLHQEMIKLQRKALGKTLDKVQKGSSRAMNEAYDLLHANHTINDQYQNIVKDMLPRGMGLGTLIYFAGGYPKVLAAAGTRAMSQYTKTLFNNRVFASTFKQLLQAQAKNNVRLVQQLAPKLDREAEKALAKLPEQERDSIRRATEQMKSNTR